MNCAVAYQQGGEGQKLATLVFVNTLVAAEPHVRRFSPLRVGLFNFALTLQ